MKTINKILSTLITIPVVGLIFIIGQMSLMEGYNVFVPYIDTEFAQNYSPELFDKITYDINIDSVVSIVGQPLSKRQDTVDGYVRLRYTYTNDGFFGRSEKSERYSIGDFAWYRSKILFDNQGRIVHIDKGWSYD